MKQADQKVIDEENQQYDRGELQAQIALLPNIEHPLSIHEFIQPIGEEINDDDDDIFASVVEQYSTDKEGSVEEPEEGDIEAEVVNTTDALKALEIVRLWEMQQENGQQVTLQALDRIERRVMQARYESRKQTTIESFFQHSPK
jgi:hypothetical protein